MTKTNNNLSMLNGVVSRAGKNLEATLGTNKNFLKFSRPNTKYLLSNLTKPQKFTLIFDHLLRTWYPVSAFLPTLVVSILFLPAVVTKKGTSLVFLEIFL